MRHERDTYASGDGATRPERQDCAVRAFAVAACLPYERAHELYAAAGRRDRKGTPRRITASVLQAAGFGRALARALAFDRGKRIAKIDPRGRWIGTADDGRYGSIRFSWERQRPTLSRFVADHASGHWLVAVRNHMLAVVDGVVHDWRPTPNAKVCWAVRLDV